MTHDSDLPASQYLALFKYTPRNAALALKAGAAFHAEGDVDKAVAVWHLGYDLNSNVRTLQDDPSAEPALRELSNQADTALRAHLSNLHRKTVETVAEELGKDLSRIHDAVWVQFADRPFEYRHANQKPSVFYVPGLPPTPVADTAALPWAAALEAAFDDIRAEFDAAMQSAQLRPYIHQNTVGDEWRKLAGSLDWGSLYLFQDARPTQAIGHFPKTMAALDQVPLARKDGAPIELFFSVLKPGAHIPPHFGQANSRFTAHLPIHIPGSCGIRIDQDTHEWTEGKILAFDDSFEHEAWNKSDQPRAVLIFEVPHPDMTREEDAAISRVYEAFDGWMQKRASILGL